MVTLNGIVVINEDSGDMAVYVGFSKAQIIDMYAPDIAHVLQVTHSEARIRFYDMYSLEGIDIAVNKK